MSDVTPTAVTSPDALLPISAMELAALLCSRVCHDVISPVGSIVNGIEVLEDENAADMREAALELIAKSARQASARLQFTRLAFGAAGSAGAQLDLGDAEQVSRGMIEDDRTRIEWLLPREFQAKNKVKLLLNLMLLAAASVARGGVVRVTAEGEGEAMGFVLAASGPRARIPSGAEALVAGDVPAGGLAAQVIQPYYTGLLARSCGMIVSLAQDDDVVTFTALAR
ncbi:histidine phosphotransferase family protein [Xanthobacter sp. V0B-10]|uniref:histidine phosphotransferase ChpT n=1 Tax=Xanthobacter albus TaxID=3119929 RepID=UPI00372B1CA4